MRYLQVLTVFVVTVLSIEANTFSVENLLTSVAFNPNKVCPNANNNGNVCSDCRTVKHCQRKSDHSWSAETVATCASGKVCKNGNCVKGKCDGGGGSEGSGSHSKFVCSTVGVFPDPKDCSKYHFCVPDPKVSGNVLHFGATCENSKYFGYDAVTKSCSNPKCHGKCKNDYAPDCSEDDVGVCEGDPTIYYECRKYVKPDGTVTNEIYPYQYACPNGQIYDVDRKKCTSHEQEGCSGGSGGDGDGDGDDSDDSDDSDDDD